MKTYASETAVNEQVRRAAARVAEAAERRGKNIALIEQRGGLALADSPSRVASRIDRLSRFRSDIRPINPAGIIAQDPEAMTAAGAVLERVLNVSNLLGIEYLEGGVFAARSVGRVNIRDENGRLTGYGTGSLVAPGLLLTNNHVLPAAEVAANSTIEFDYQDGIDGQPLQPRVFHLVPSRFFLTDGELDFALVAVGDGSEDLSAYRFNPLVEEEGKAIVGDFVTIIQHPGGERKQVALRDNRVVDVLDNFLHYETDTMPGSSGSPVFNDQWEVIALHHASVPAPAHGELGGIVNEGIRVSRLVKFIRSHALPAQKSIIDQLLAHETAAVGIASNGSSTPAPWAQPQTVQAATSITTSLASGNGSASATASLPEAISIDPDYSTRRGYDPEFLGGGENVVPLPSLSERLLSTVATNSLATDEPKYVLPYHHFSIVLNKERRLALFTAVNIDGATGFRLKREPDRWSFDPRVPSECQIGEELYVANSLDRGHLVRRLDPAWGKSARDAKVCNDDTFHYTNCTPQHRDFNEQKTLWAGLEEYILTNAGNLRFRVCVFTGPVFDSDDDEYRGLKLPRQFWKLVVMVKKTGELSASAYLLSQADLIAGLEVKPEAFSYGAYRTYQVRVQRIEQLTGLSFAGMAKFDPLERQEGVATGHELGRLDDIRL